MIFIDRGLEPIPPVLDGTNSRGGKETTKAIKHYTSGKSTAYNFSMYRNPQVKEALVRLFNEKCAYCESTFLHTYPGDVEHFRPKGEITEASPLKPGYYWLAAEWDNLLLSCRNCNQKLKHSIHGKAGKVTMGKMNQFPLSDTTKYIRTHNNPNSIKSEESYRLLINPCIEDPEDYFTYDLEHALIKPKVANGKLNAMAQNSIDVFVLQRVPLVFAREKILIDIFAQVQRVKEAIKNVNDHLESGSNVQFYFDKILKRELLRLKQFTEPTEEFSALAKQVVGEFMSLNFNTTT